MKLQPSSVTYPRSSTKRRPRHEQRPSLERSKLTLPANVQGSPRSKLPCANHTRHRSSHFSLAHVPAGITKHKSSHYNSLLSTRSFTAKQTTQPRAPARSDLHSIKHVHSHTNSPATQPNILNSATQAAQRACSRDTTTVRPFDTVCSLDTELMLWDKATSVARAVLHDSSPLALKPEDSITFAASIADLHSLMNTAFAESTRTKDRGSNWNWWSSWCRTLNTPPLRTYSDSRATHIEAARERYLWGAALPWILARMRPGPGRSIPKPSSARHVLLGVRRIHVSLGYEPPPMAAMNLAFRGILRTLMNEHGPEVLETKRTEPIPHTLQCKLLACFKQPYLRLHTLLVPPNPDYLTQSLAAMLCLLSQSGMRKAEVTCVQKNFTRCKMSRANLTWRIASNYYSEPSPDQLNQLVPGRDYAIIKPPPSKSDQFGFVWGSRPIYLLYSPNMTINAATELKNLELLIPCTDRRTMPLFVDNKAQPITGAEADKILKAALHHVSAPKMYSWHSFRVALACSLLAAGAQTEDILSLCRWQTTQSLRIYARYEPDKYTALLQAAYGKDFSQLQPCSMPCIGENQLAPLLADFNLKPEHDDHDHPDKS